MFKFQTPVKQKAAFRVNQVVTCDYYGEMLFKVESKEWDENGNIFYTIRRTVGTDKFDNFPAISGVREKTLNKAYA